MPLKIKNVLRPCPYCRGSASAYNAGEFCWDCKDTQLLPAELPATKKAQERWLAILHVLNLYGPCEADEIYQLLEKRYSLFSISHALTAMSWSQWGLVKAARPQAWKLTSTGKSVQKLFCPECFLRIPKHLPECSCPEIEKASVATTPKAISDLLGINSKVVKQKQI